MEDLISRQALYEKTAEWEAQALHMVEKTMNDEDPTEWRRWSTILTERSAFKFDVADAPPAQPEIVRCKDCKHYNDYFVECESPYGLKHIGTSEDYCCKAERREE